VDKVYEQDTEQTFIFEKSMLCLFPVARSNAVKQFTEAKKSLNKFLRVSWARNQGSNLFEGLTKQYVVRKINQSGYLTNFIVPLACKSRNIRKFTINVKGTH